MGYEGAEDAESDDGDDEWADDGAEFLSGDKDLDYLSGEFSLSLLRSSWELMGSGRYDGCWG